MSELDQPGADQPAEPTRVQLRALWLPFILFTVICVADTISSVIMLLNGMMEEYNPLMRFVWERGGVVAFVAIKSLLIVLPLALFNAMKLRRYWLIRRTVWVTIFGYCLIYGLFFYLGNY